MSSFLQAAKNNPVQISKLFNENAEEKDQEILSMLDDIHNDLSRLGISQEPKSKISHEDSPNLSRKILFSTQSQLQTNKLARIGALYQADQALANEVSAILTRDETMPPHLRRLMRSALREKLLDSTDDFTVALRLVAKPGVRLIAGLTNLRRESDQLLQEFFQLNREPNLAEMEMLAVACRVPMQTTAMWFALKRDQTRRLFVMQGLATKGSRLGTKLRKRERVLREGPVLRPSLPPEFSDPDLHEGWEAADVYWQPGLRPSWSGMWETKSQARGPRSATETTRGGISQWISASVLDEDDLKANSQKDISGFLTRMWQNDPFKAKWSILAKAYSIIDESDTKNDTPLDKFLALTCPLVGNIPRDDYLGVVGWNIVDTAGVKNMERMYTADISSFPENILTTNLSSKESVAHCQRVSYVYTNDADVARNQRLTAALAMAAQPMFESAPQDNIARSHHNGHIQQSNNMVGNSGLATTFTRMVAQPVPNDASSSPPVFDFSNPTSPYQPDHHDLFVGGTTIQSALNQNNNNAIGATSSLDFDPFNMNQDAAFASNSIGTYLAPSSNDFPETFIIDDLLSSDLFDMAK
ncbi:hypothetical protein QM012_000384 [Aureobasidium pullulans]|uniref:Mating-type protein MAT-1 n=1 Tax=Aureobasidium pullulans TaxID=5580 RepID=A0ABR0TX08_AURPU